MLEMGLQGLAWVCPDLRGTCWHSDTSIGYLACGKARTELSLCPSPASLASSAAACIPCVCVCLVLRRAQTLGDNCVGNGAGGGGSTAPNPTLLSSEVSIDTELLDRAAQVIAVQDHPLMPLDETERLLSLQVGPNALVGCVCSDWRINLASHIAMALNHHQPCRALPCLHK